MEKEKPKPFISVVLCTYNHSGLLRGCLESLCQQTLEKCKYEIIVVDNNSTDNTHQIVEEFSDHENIYYVMEMSPGLSHARNRGLQEAKGLYIAYIDDDARAASNWLEIAINLLKSAQPELDCLGGPYKPFYTSPKPEWFLDQYEIRGFGNLPKYLTRTEYISGSNMIWAKTALDKIGGFDATTGVVGNQLRLGEETNAFEKLWLLREKPQLFYSPDLIIYHWTPVYKMTVSYRLKRKFAEGQYQSSQKKLAGVPEKIMLLGKLRLNFSKASLRFLLKYKAHSHWQNWVVEEGARIVYYLGFLLGVLGFERRISQPGEYV